MAEFLGQYSDDEDSEPPDWVLDDRKHFAETLDKDKSGELERDEIRDWIIPDLKESKKETAHLIDGADDDGDGKLTSDEIVLHFSLFVGSTVTDHGKTLKRHDEF